MKRGRQLAFTALLAVLALAARDRRGRAEPASSDLLVIVNAKNRVAASAARLEQIFLRQDLTWDDGERIIPLNANPDSERRQRFDRVVLGMTPDEVARYWLDQRIRGAGEAPREVGDAVTTVKLIARLPGAISYVPAEVRLDGVRAIARIHNDRVVSP